MSRTELTGLPAIPETLLSDALVATLPANDAPAPWECHCSGLVWLGRGGRAAAAALPPALGGSTGLLTVGGFVRYTDTPVGPYDEVLGIVGSRSGLRPWGHVAFMAVDSPASLVGGRTNWAMPKTLARFDGDPGAVMTGTGADGVWRVRASARPLGPAVPLRLTGTARQQFADGRVGDSVLVCSARARPALVSVEVTSTGSLPRWLRPGRRVGAVIESARFTLAEPRFG
ncbi:acetoacetate decarboxylase family protein [Mycobacterium sp. 1274756.6]|uniref:acetoacetate decarboxylase family protein n=1 Tax=Mycobacterium sp. 1274756.6 TaxID=1834076 RepID=UPI0007FCE3D9|nr:acetoacetate decarboxylase family protein [Mycobacterium sp. 1274756.6]OBJ71009.1 hypothetical protein A5643_08965 [Mycobacterium sp. 1274756.6]